MSATHPYSSFYHSLLVKGIRFCNWVCRVHYVVEGKENIPAEGQYLVVSNHLAREDPMISIAILKHLKLAYLSKEGNFHIPITGHVIRKNHFISLDRSNDSNALDAVNEAIEMVKEEGYSIGVCPEGKRNRSPERMLPFRPGCFRIAKRTGIPVLLLAFVGTENIHLNAPWRRTDVKVNVLGALDPSEFKNTVELAKAAQERIREALD